MRSYIYGRLLLMFIHIYIYIYICMNIYTGTHGIAVTASALEKPGTRVRVLASVGFFHLFRCVLSSMLPLQSVGRSNFVRVCVNLTSLIKKRHILIRTAVIYIYIYSGS